MTKNNKVVLITGASSGMGKHAAIFLAERGYTVYAAARRNMDELKRNGIIPLKMDVTDQESVLAGVKKIMAEQGRVDVLVNNAGFGSYGAIEDMPIADARYQLEVNVLGVAAVTQAVIPHMRSQHSGTIINISSIGGKVAMPFGAWYHASKFALEAFSDSLRVEVKPFGIKVVVIEPGGVKSEWATIAMDNLQRISGNGVYKDKVIRFISTLSKFESRNADPVVISELIRKAIEQKQPKTRYSGGLNAKPLLFMRKILSDSMMDRLMASQLK